METVTKLWKFVKLFYVYLKLFHLLQYFTFTNVGIFGPFRSSHLPLDGSIACKFTFIRLEKELI